ncbi:related to related molecular chaperone [Cephalotrichum gorgonifer]|uniref:Related to related molecular chaperone n=1 Tax=Cephalotrichum gorgonifer TaxID=2041049 RepID=A0AAE8MP46_9PEZI|nr:related to related molecular chaperone [Cephalotrichum gorgonifer]
MPLSALSASRAATRLCAQCRVTPRATQALFSTSAPAHPLSPQPRACRQQTQTQKPQSPSRARYISWTAARRADAASSSARAAAASEAAPAPHATYYDLFPQSLPDGPPPRGPFAVDVRALRREFLQLQARAHPDIQPFEHRTRAQSASAHLNEAFRTIADPLLRAQYLLSLRGLDVAGDETGQVADMELLADVMEAREEIEEAQGEEDLVGPREVNDGRIEESVEALERAFEEDDMDAAKKEAVRLRYWFNIKQCLHDWEPGKPVELHH